MRGFDNHAPGRLPAHPAAFDHRRRRRGPTATAPARGRPSSPPWRWKPGSPSRCATSRLAPAWHLQVEQDRRAPLQEAPVERDEETAEYRLLAGRWHTCFPDLSGGQRMIGQVQGRTAADAAWLALAPAAWRDAIQVVLHRHGHDLPVRGPQDALEGQIAVDLFHVVHLASNTVADVRRAPSGASTAAAAPGTPSTESRTCSPSNLEDLTGDQFAKIIGTLDTDAGDSRSSSPGSPRRSSATPSTCAPASPGPRPANGTSARICTCSTTGAPSTTTSRNSSPSPRRYPASPSFR